MQPDSNWSVDADTGTLRCEWKLLAVWPTSAGTVRVSDDGR
jgi:hypothetical protein